jgi:hypothetical protein
MRRKGVPFAAIEVDLKREGRESWTKRLDIFSRTSFSFGLCYSIV